MTTAMTPAMAEETADETRRSAGVSEIWSAVSANRTRNPPPVSGAGAFLVESEQLEGLGQRVLR